MRFPRHTAGAALGAALLSLALPTPAPAVPSVPSLLGLDESQITIDDTGYLDENGAITLSGTYRCDTHGASGPVFISSSIRQGDIRRGIGGSAARCDGEVHRWRNSDRAARPQRGMYAPGQAAVDAALLRLSTEGALPLPSVLAGEERTVDLVSGPGTVAVS
ncbi:DUF6299 family protein [Streptomyces sp. LX-29]|uniref:DUF6299 family protein n=1 Tax=Streptomyces sp. LX-29 TaxID=2900152 RepID=UPI00240CF2C9|nr:DUF6299 family protein [Streptomyces sp. LX-29]WFB09747.1 DUF6299 family protein [Streptomyces sp. LX-29]